MLSGFERVTRMLRHDLRSPLQSINNAAQMMEVDPSTSAEMLTIIRDNVKYILEVLDDLRTMTTVRALVKEPLEVDALIRRLMDRRILPDEIDVELRLQQGVKLQADDTKLTRVIDNLINNAVEAMPDGGELLMRVSRDRQSARIEVIDTGCGMSAEQLNKLFQAYYSTKMGGSGLGLSTTRRIITEHGGSITVESEQGRGTRFIVDLPLAQAGSVRE